MKTIKEENREIFEQVVELVKLNDCHKEDKQLANSQLDHVIANASIHGWSYTRIKAIRLRDKVNAMPMF